MFFFFFFFFFLVSHGFSREQALEALEKFQGNMEEVFNDLMGEIGE